MNHLAKRSLIIVALLIAIMPCTLRAQEQAGDHEVGMSYGRLSGTEVFKLFRERRPNPDHPTYRVERYSSGNIFATYRYNVRRGISFGVTMGTEFFAYDRYTNPAFSSPVFIARYHVNVTTLAIESRFVYYNSKFLRLYGLAGFGGRLYHERSSPRQEFDGLPSSKAFFNCQLTPLGFGFGDQLKGFVELGFGYKGMMNFGLSCRFKRNMPKPEAKSTAQ